VIFRFKLTSCENYNNLLGAAAYSNHSFNHEIFNLKFTMAHAFYETFKHHIDV